MTVILSSITGCANSDQYSINQLVSTDVFDLDTKSAEIADEKDGIEINVSDITDGRSIDDARFIIVDLNKEFNITKENNIIRGIPYKGALSESSYPYGYTTITYADGYYPRIDHNFKFTSEGGGIKLYLKLVPIGKLDNKSFIEEFNRISEGEMVEFLNYYNLVQYDGNLKSHDMLNLEVQPSEIESGANGLKVNVMNIKDGRSIDCARFIIVDLNKEFNITKENNIIRGIPYKGALRESDYPYGYTTITYADGYYPRIDHNFKFASGKGAELAIELTPIGEFDNSSFTEVFHESSEVEIAEFLEYYNLN